MLHLWANPDAPIAALSPFQEDVEFLLTKSDHSSRNALNALLSARHIIIRQRRPSAIFYGRRTDPL